MGRRKIPYTYIPDVESYFHHSIFSLEIKPSQIKNAGKGVYTMDTIPKNTFIDFYTGHIIPYPISRYYIAIDNDHGIDAGTFPRCYMAMMNDIVYSEFKINCEFIILPNDQVAVYSIYDILPGEELFVDYGDEYWK